MRFLDCGGWVKATAAAELRAQRDDAIAPDEAGSLELSDAAGHRSIALKGKIHAALAAAFEDLTSCGSWRG